MRRRSRQIESSEIALMAVVTKAMGAFLILMIFGFKYYVEDADGRREADNAAEQLQSAQSALDDARELLRQASFRHGDVSQEDFETALQQLNAVQENLKQALASIAELKARLDQTLSQNSRVRDELAKAVEELKQARAELLAAEERLAETEARLRNLETERERLKQPVVFFQLKIAKAEGARFRLAYSFANDPTHPLQGNSTPLTEAGDKLKYTPMSKADRVDGDGFAACDQSSWSTESEFVQQHLYLRQTRPRERIALYVKLLNALPQGGKGYSGTIEMDARGTFARMPLDISEAAPFSFVGLVDVVGKGATVVELDESQRAWYQAKIEAAPDDSNISCRPFAEENRSELMLLVMNRLRPLLVPPDGITMGAEIRMSPTERKRGESMLNELARGVADQQWKLDEIVARSGLLAITASRMVEADVSVPTKAKEENLRARLQAAKFPDPMIEEFLHRIRDGWWTASTVEDRLKQLKIPALEGSFIQRVEKYKVPSWYANELESAVESERIAEAKVFEFLELIHVGRLVPPKPPIDRNKNPLVLALRDELERRGYSKAFVNLTIQWIVTGEMELDQAAEFFSLSVGNPEPAPKDKP